MSKTIERRLPRVPTNHTNRFANYHPPARREADFSIDDYVARFISNRIPYREYRHRRENVSPFLALDARFHLLAEDMFTELQRGCSLLAAPLPDSHHEQLKRFYADLRCLSYESEAFDDFLHHARLCSACWAGNPATWFTRETIRRICSVALERDLFELDLHPPSLLGYDSVETLVPTLKNRCRELAAYCCLRLQLGLDRFVFGTAELGATRANVCYPTSTCALASPKTNPRTVDVDTKIYVEHALHVHRIGNAYLLDWGQRDSIPLPPWASTLLSHPLKTALSANNFVSKFIKLLTGNLESERIIAHSRQLLDYSPHPPLRHDPAILIGNVVLAAWHPSELESTVKHCRMGRFYSPEPERTSFQA